MTSSSTWYIVYVGVIVLVPTLLQALGLSVALPILYQLNGYYAAAEKPLAVKPKPKGPKSSKNASSEPAVPHQLYQIPLSKEYIITAPFFERFESCVLAVITFLVLTVLYVGFPSFGEISTGLTFAALMLVVITAFALFQMEVLSEDIPSTEKKIFVGLGLAGGIGCWLALTFLPASYLNVDMAAIAKDVGNMINEPIKKKMEKHSGSPKFEPIAVSAFFVPIAVSVLAGVQLMVLLTPAVRFGRALYTIMAPPRWASSVVKSSTWQVILAKVSFVLPLLAILSWMEPFVDLLPDEVQEIEWLAAGMLLATALVPLLVLRQFVQAHLYKGFMEWYTLSHDGKSTGHKSLLISAKLELVWNDRAKAAVEMMSLSLFLLPPAVLLLLGSPLAESFGLDYQQSLTSAFVCKFFSIWTCSVWWLFSAATVFFNRMGFVSN